MCLQEGLAMAEPPAEVAPFVSELLATGEVLAYLHLSGHHAATDPKLKTFHKYETTAGGKHSEKPLVFEYEVVAVEGANGGQHGRAVVYRPLHAPDRYVIAFRAVRAQCCAAAMAGADAIIHGHPADVDAMLDPKFVQTTWLPAEARVSRGICRHAGSTWAIERGGLQSWLTDECPPNANIHFVGLSLAGALTQMTALRAVIENETALGERAHVLTFGALPWTNQGGRDCYERSLGSRAAHLVTELYQQTPGVFPPAVEPWWIESTHERELVSFGNTHAREYSVIDPLSSGCAPEHVLMHNTFAIGDPDQPATDPTTAVKADFWHAEGVSLRLHTVAPQNIVSRREIGKLMTHGLEEDDQLKIDYLRLHRGRAYKVALTALVRSAMQKRQAAEEAAAAAVAAEAVVAEAAKAQEAVAAEAVAAEAAKAQAAAASSSGRATELYEELLDQATAAPAPEVELPTAPAPAPEPEIEFLKADGSKLQDGSLLNALLESDVDTSKAGSRSRPPSTSPGRPQGHGMMRRNSSKRSLAEMQEANPNHPLFTNEALTSPSLGAQDDHNAHLFAPLFLDRESTIQHLSPPTTRNGDGPLSKMTSHGSISARLDEINMF